MLIGIQVDADIWIHHWLAVRRQRVYINQTYSILALVIVGVQQDSVLGQLLFLIYILTT